MGERSGESDSEVSHSSLRESGEDVSHEIKVKEENVVGLRKKKISLADLEAHVSLVCR